MGKIKVSAETILSILRNIMNDEDINRMITDVSAPVEWQGKRVQDVLNVEYYTCDHRPIDTAIVVSELMEQGETPSSLYSLERSFCVLSRGSVERVFSKDNDIVTVTANLEYWLQSDKVKLLEDMFEDMTIETTGIRIPIQIGEEHRKAIFVFESLDIGEIQEATEFGKMAICETNVTIIFYPDVITKEDYKVEFLVYRPTSKEGEFVPVWVHLPMSGISLSTDMSQKSVPGIKNPSEVGNINLSKVNSFVFAFEGLRNNEFIEMLSKISLSSGFSLEGDKSVNYDVNTQVIMRITRDELPQEYDCVIKNHTITVQDDTGNETHSLTLVKRGI